VACDFVFVSDTLKPHVKQMRIDGETRGSDHQPVMIELG
jgi:exonuclease III